MKQPAAFLTNLAVEREPGDEMFTLTQPLEFYSAVAQQTFVAPKGFRTNFVTGRRVPGIAWLAGTLSEEASAVHDLLYTEQPVSRAMADRVFVEALGVVRARNRRIEAARGKNAFLRGFHNAIDVAKQGLMYAGLRLGGGTRWEQPGPGIVPPDTEVLGG